MVVGPEYVSLQDMALHRIGLTALAAGLLLTTAAQAQTELTVYSAIEAEDLKRYAETSNQDHTDIKINWVRDSTGVVTAKMMAEKNHQTEEGVRGVAGKQGEGKRVGK